MNEVCLFALPLLALGTGASAADPVNFDDHIKPILRRHCLACHGNDNQEADLNLPVFLFNH